VSGVKGGSHMDADRGSPTVGGHCPSVSGVKGGFNLPLLYRMSLWEALVRLIPC